MTGPDLTILNWLLAASPLVVLAGAMLWLNRPAEQAAAAACALAVALALLAFGAEWGHVGIAAAKGVNLAVFVLTIVWAAVFLYNILDRLGAIDAIGRHMAALSNDQLAQALIIGWGFSSTIQGVTGFGVPVAVSAPLLVMLGVPPIRAAAMSLVGHGWAVTFGSLGSSYYTLQLVTGIDEAVIAPHMALLFLPVTIASGALVAHIQGGLRAVLRSLPLVIVAGGIMGGAMYGLALVGAPQVASLGAGMLGTAALVVLTRTPLLVGARRSDTPTLPEAGAGDRAAMPPALAFMPYFVLIALSFGAQVGPVKEAVSGLRVALDFPGFTTGQGFTVAPADDYAAIRLLAHPAPLILIATAVSAAVYVATKRWRRGLVSGRGEVHLQPVRRHDAERPRHGRDGRRDGRHGDDGAAGAGHREGVGAVLPAGVAVHRPAGGVHERQQHQLQRHVRAAAGGDGASAGHRLGDDCEHAVHRRVRGQLDGPRQGGRRRDSRRPRRRGAEHLPPRDPLRRRANAPRRHRGARSHPVPHGAGAVAKPADFGHTTPSVFSRSMATEDGAELGASPMESYRSFTSQ